MLDQTEITGIVCSEPKFVNGCSFYLRVKREKPVFCEATENFKGLMPKINETVVLEGGFLRRSSLASQGQQGFEEIFRFKQIGYQCSSGQVEQG